MDHAVTVDDYSGSDSEDDHRRERAGSHSALSRAGTLGNLLSDVDDVGRDGDGGDRSRRGGPVTLDAGGKRKSRRAKALSKLTGGRLGEGRTRAKLAKATKGRFGAGNTRAAIRAKLSRKSSRSTPDEDDRDARRGSRTPSSRLDDDGASGGSRSPRKPRRSTRTATAARKPSMLKIKSEQRKMEREERQRDRDEARERDGESARESISRSPSRSRVRDDDGEAERARQLSREREEQLSLDRLKQKKKSQQREAERQRKSAERDARDEADAAAAVQNAERLQREMTERKKAQRAEKSASLRLQSQVGLVREDGGFAVPVGNPAPPPPPSRVDRGPKTPPSGSEREPRRKGGVSQPSLGPPTFEPPPNRRPSPAPPVSESLRLSDERSSERDRVPTPPSEVEEEETDEEEMVDAFDADRDAPSVRSGSRDNVFVAPPSEATLRDERRASASKADEEAAWQEVLAEEAASEARSGEQSRGGPRVPRSVNREPPRRLSEVERERERDADGDAADRKSRNSRRMGTVLSRKESSGLTEEGILWKEKEKMQGIQHLKDITTQEEIHGAEIRALKEQARDDLRTQQELELRVEELQDLQQGLKDEMMTKISRATAAATEKSYQRALEADRGKAEAIRKATMEKRAIALMQRHLQWHKQAQRKAFERINRQAHAAAYEDRHMRQENMIKRRFLKRIANVKIASAFVKLREGGHRAKYEMHVHELTQKLNFITPRLEAAELAEVDKKRNHAEAIARQQRDHDTELQRVRREHDDRVLDHEDDKERMRREHAAKIRDHDAVLDRLRREHEDAISDQDRRHRDDATQKLRELEREHAKKLAEHADEKEEELKERRRLEREKLQELKETADDAMEEQEEQHQQNLEHQLREQQRRHDGEVGKHLDRHGEVAEQYETEKERAALLEEKNTLLDAEHNSALGEIADLKNHVGEQENTIDDLEDEIAEKARENAELNDRLRALKTALDKKLVDAESRRINELDVSDKKRLRDLAAERAKCKTALNDEKGLRRSESLDMTRKHALVIAEMQAQLDELEYALEANGIERDSALETAARSSISVADLRQELRDLEQQGEVDRQRFESEMEEAEAEVLTLHDEIEASSMKVDDLLHKISQLEEIGIHDAALLAQAVEDRDNLAVELDRIRTEHHLHVDASKAERESLQRAHDAHADVAAAHKLRQQRRFLLRMIHVRAASAFARLRTNAAQHHSDTMSSAAQKRHDDLERSLAEHQMKLEAEAIAASQRHGELTKAHQRSAEEVHAGHEAHIKQLRADHASRAADHAAAHERALAEALRKARERHTAIADDLVAQHDAALHERERAHDATCSAMHAATQSAHAAAVSEVNAAHRRELEVLRSGHARNSAEAREAHAVAIAAVRKEQAAAIAEAQSDHVLRHGEHAAEHAEAIAFARREAQLEIDASKSAMAALAKQLADASAEHNDEILALTKQHALERSSKLKLAAARELELAKAEKTAREFRNEKHEELVATLLSMHAMRLAELTADDVYYIYVKGEEHGPYTRQLLQEWTDCGYLREPSAAARREGAPQIASDIVDFPITSLRAKPRKQPASRPIWSSAHIKGNNSFNHVPKHRAPVHEDRPNSPQARRRRKGASLSPSTSTTRRTALRKSNVAGKQKEKDSVRFATSPSTSTVGSSGRSGGSMSGSPNGSVASVQSVRQQRVSRQSARGASCSSSGRKEVESSKLVAEPRSRGQGRGRGRDVNSALSARQAESMSRSSLASSKTVTVVGGQSGPRSIAASAASQGNTIDGSTAKRAMAEAAPSYPAKAFTETPRRDEATQAVMDSAAAALRTTASANKAYAAASTTRQYADDIATKEMTTGMTPASVRARASAPGNRRGSTTSGVSVNTHAISPNGSGVGTSSPAPPIRSPVKQKPLPPPGISSPPVPAAWDEKYFYSSRSAVPATLVDAEVSASNLDAAIARVTAELGPPTSAAGAPSAAGKRTLLQQQRRRGDGRDSGGRGVSWGVKPRASSSDTRSGLGAKPRRSSGSARSQKRTAGEITRRSSNGEIDVEAEALAAEGVLKQIRGQLRAINM